MANTWTKNPDGSLRCKRCETSFAAGDHCSCPAGGPARTTQKPRISSETAAGLPADNPSKRRAPARGLTVRECHRGLRAVVEAARRHRKAAERLPTEDELVPSEDGRRNVWKQAWQGAHSKFKCTGDAIEKERKAWGTALEAAQEVEQLDETLRKERTARGLVALRQGRPDIAAAALGKEEPVH